MIYILMRLYVNQNCMLQSKIDLDYIMMFMII